MRTIGTSIVFLILLAILGGYMIKAVPLKIQSSIQTDMQRQFSANDLSGIKILIDGRDVSLQGTVQSQSKIDQAMKLASNVAGVRVVMTEINLVAEKDNLNIKQSEIQSTDHN